MLDNNCDTFVAALLVLIVDHCLIAWGVADDVVRLVVVDMFVVGQINRSVV